VTARGGSHFGAACSDGAARLRPLSAGATQKPQERFSRRWGLARAGPTPALCSHDQGCAFSQIGTRRVAPRFCVFSQSGTRVAPKFVSTKRWNRRYAGNGSHQCQTLGQTAQYRRFGRGLMCTVDSTPLNSDAQGTPSLRIRVGQRGQGTRTSAARRGSVVAAASIAHKHRRLVARWRIGSIEMAHSGGDRSHSNGHAADASGPCRCCATAVSCRAASRMSRRACPSPSPAAHSAHRWRKLEEPRDVWRASATAVARGRPVALWSAEMQDTSGALLQAASGSHSGAATSVKSPRLPC